MGIESEGLVFVADEPMDGISDIVENRAAATDDKVIETVAGTEAAEVARVGDRGLGDMWRSIIDKIRGRRVRQVIDGVVVPVPWLSFHVPPDGKGHLRVSTSSSGGFGVKLKAVGSGWGTGRKITLALERDFQERNRCVCITLSLRTRVTLYEADEPPRADILGAAGYMVSSLEECPDCVGTNEAAGALVEPAGEWIDLRSDPVGQTVAQTVDIVDRSSFESSVAFKVPGLGTEIGIDWSREQHLSCDLKYVFRGGRRYSPTRTFGAPSDLPYWRWE